MTRPQFDELSFRDGKLRQCIGNRGRAGMTINPAPVSEGSSMRALEYYGSNFDDYKDIPRSC